VEPDRELARELERGEGGGVVILMGVGGGVADDAQLMALSRARRSAKASLEDV
jgi:hypothetical protein